MGDVGEYWNDVRWHKRQQKMAREPFNREWVAQLETRAQVRRIGPDGPHLRVNGVLDFWPSTGRQVVIGKPDGVSVGQAKRAINEARKAAEAAVKTL